MCRMLMSLIVLAIMLALIKVYEDHGEYNFQFDSNIGSWTFISHPNIRKHINNCSNNANSSSSRLQKVRNEVEKTTELFDKCSSSKESKSFNDMERNFNRRLPEGHGDVKEKETVTTEDPGMNTTHINGVLMEPVNANYTRNIYFSVKTTNKYYRERVLPLILTWFQVIDKNKVSNGYFKLQ